MAHSVHINIDVVMNGDKRRITEQDRRQFAEGYGLTTLIPGRFSEILVVDMMVNAEVNGIDPSCVIQEIVRLESGGSGYTKPATQFKRPPLFPLWHQHYFSAHYLPNNIQNELNRSFDQVWKASMGPEGSPIQGRHIDTFVHNIVEGTIVTRSDEGRMTGEWLVFAKQPTGAIYLCMAEHLTSDQQIYEKLSYCCKRQFPFLEPFVSSR